MTSGRNDKILSSGVTSVGNRGRIPPLVFLSFLVFLAFALFTFRLDYQSLWYDEGFSVYLARMSLGEKIGRAHV